MDEQEGQKNKHVSETSMAPRIQEARDTDFSGNTMESCDRPQTGTSPKCYHGGNDLSTVQSETENNNHGPFDSSKSHKSGKILRVNNEGLEILQYLKLLKTRQPLSDS